MYFPYNWNRTQSVLKAFQRKTLERVLIFYFDGYVLQRESYYNAYAKRYGVMEGVGKLSDKQVKGRSVSFKFIRKGRYNPVWKVQVVNTVIQNKIKRRTI